jgi:hypothetical protein
MFHAMTSSFLRRSCKTLPLVMCLLAHIGAADAWAQYEVSSWRDHFPYGAAMGLMVTQDEVVARTEYALFSVDTSTYEVRRQVKGTALNQGNPSAVAYDADRDQWVVGYGDGGIDLKSDFGTLNIPDLRIAQIVGSKKIHSIEVFGNMAYLATACGGRGRGSGPTRDCRFVVTDPSVCSRRSLLHRGPRGPLVGGDGNGGVGRTARQLVPRQP